MIFVADDCEREILREHPRHGKTPNETSTDEDRKSSKQGRVCIQNTSNHLNTKLGFRELNPI